MTGLKTALKYFYFSVFLVGIILVNLHLYEISKQLSQPAPQPVQVEGAQKTDTLVIMKLVDILSLQTRENSLMKDKMSDLEVKLAELSEKMNRLNDEMIAANLRNRNDRTSKRREQSAR